MSFPSRLSVLVSGSSAPGSAGSGICLTQTTTFMRVILCRDRVAAKSSPASPASSPSDALGEQDARRTRGTTTAAPMRTARSGRRVPSCWPTRMASASAATMPSVEPSQTANGLPVVARVIVASMVLSPSSARKNATDAATMADRLDRSTLASSSSVSSSPRSVQAANPRNASAGDDR